MTILNKKYCNFLFLSSVLLVLFISFGCNNTNQKKSYTVQEFSYSTKNDSAKIQSITEADTLGEYTFKNVILEPKGRPTQGGLIVSKGELKDTIYDCTYSRVPDYKILYDGSKEYLFTSCLMNGGGQNRQSFYLWSLNEKNFMKQLFFKELYTGKEGVYNSKTGDLINANNVNIHPLTDEIQNWIGDSFNEEIYWLMIKDYNFSMENNKAILVLDSIYMLLKMSDELPPLEILSGTKQYEFELNER